MEGRAFFSISIILIALFSYISCESKLYPPTDPPELSNMVITSDSYRSSTTTVRAGDMVYISVDVSDPEDDPETLSLSVLSGETEVASNEVSASRIFDDTTWETWFDSDGLAVGSYSINLTAEDSEENESDTLSEDFTIEADNRSSVDVTAGAITIADVDYILKDADASDPYNASYTPATGEPFRITYSVTNNTDIKIDILKIPFTVNIDWDDDSDPLTPAVAEAYNAEAIVSDLDGGETLNKSCNVSILNTNRTVNLPIVYAEADCTAIIY